MTIKDEDGRLFAILDGTIERGRENLKTVDFEQVVEDSLVRVIGRSDFNFKAAIDKEIETAKQIVKAVVEEEVKEITKQLKSVVGDGALEKATGAALANVTNSFVQGRDVEVRDVANAAAGALTPIVGGFFRQSSSQLADDVGSLLGRAERNS